MNYIQNLEEETLNNENFRKVLYTDPRFQLVLMSILPMEDIGEEEHDLDQFIRVEKGEGKAILNGESFVLHDGSAIIIPKGTRHNIINTSSEISLKLYSIYAPSQHPSGTVHRTRAESVAAEKAEHGAL